MIESVYKHHTLSYTYSYSSSFVDDHEVCSCDNSFIIVIKYIEFLHLIFDCFIVVDISVYFYLTH